MFFTTTLFLINLFTLKSLFSKLKKLRNIHSTIFHLYQKNLYQENLLKNNFEKEKNQMFKNLVKEKNQKLKNLLKEKNQMFKNLLKEKNQIFKNFENEKKLKMILFKKREELKKQNKKLIYELNAIDNVLKVKESYYNLKYTSKTIEKIFKLV